MVALKRAVLAAILESLVLRISMRRRTRAHERREQCLNEEDSGNVGEALVDATQYVDNETTIGDRLSDVTEGIRERFLTMAVGGDGEVTLDKSSELSLKVGSPSFHVFMEESFDACPQVTGDLVELHDDVQDVIRDRAV